MPSCMYVSEGAKGGGEVEGARMVLKAGFFEGGFGDAESFGRLEGGFGVGVFRVAEPELEGFLTQGRLRGIVLDV